MLINLWRKHLLNSFCKEGHSGYQSSDDEKGNECDEEISIPKKNMKQNSIKQTTINKNLTIKVNNFFKLKSNQGNMGLSSRNEEYIFRVIEIKSNSNFLLEGDIFIECVKYERTSDADLDLRYNYCFYARSSQSITIKNLKLISCLVMCYKLSEDNNNVAVLYDIN